MINLNESARTQGKIGPIIIAGLLPEIYVANSVKDFLENRNSVSTTNITKSLLSLIINKDYWMYEQTLIYFENVQFKRKSNESFSLYDLSQEVDLFVPPRKIKEFEESLTLQGISDNCRIKMALAMYSPQKDLLTYIRMSKIDVNERSLKTESNIGKLVHSFFLLNISI